RPEVAGEPVAMTGTGEYRIGAEKKKAERTTPEATDMQRMLRRAVEVGCKTAVMECSSQAMDFHRCDALRYSVAVFTNLTRDHLDYHKTMEAYFYAKKRLFDGRLGERPRTSVINSDDARGLDVISRAIGICTGAPGRFERVPHAGDFAVVVDYAHTDDALLNVLGAARDVARGRIITVFGCGGDRDRTKRAPMGEAAARLSDVVILTSDNPRMDDPERILADVEVGLSAVGKSYHMFADRSKAIAHAINEAMSGEEIMIAG